MQRLKTRAQFQLVLTAGVVARTTHFAMHCVSLNAAEPLQANLFSVPDVWLGAMVPKRWAKRSVTRNTIKRQIYSVSKEHESSLAAAAHVVRLRAGFDRAHFKSATSENLKKAVRAEVELLFSKIVSKNPKVTA